MAMQNVDFPVANIKQETIAKIRQFENELKKDNGQEIVLIAYHKER